MEISEPFKKMMIVIGLVLKEKPLYMIYQANSLQNQYCQYLFSPSGYARRNSLEPEIRRRTASLSTPHRASDIQVDPAHSAILFRDARAVSNLFQNITRLKGLFVHER